MKFEQTQTTKTTLGPQIAIGEFEGHVTHAKPGHYFVYDVKDEAGFGETALVFIHEDHVQDINKLLPKLDLESVCGVDGGSYGIITKPEGSEFTSSEWFDRLEDDETSNQECTDGYVSYTNHGDGHFSVFTNEDHSVFLLDDCDIYLQALLRERGVDYNELELLNGYCVSDKVQVGYFLPLGNDKYDQKMLERPINKGTREIVALVDAIVEVAQLIPSKP